MNRIVKQDKNIIDSLTQEISEWDIETFKTISSIELTPEKKQSLVTPLKVYPALDTVLALHWHPEFIPMDIITRRIEATFPSMQEKLIIPTQHNVLMTYEGYAGVEVDCFSRAFNQKVQLLLHFREEKVKEADTLKSMLAHTYKYRTGQLLEFIDAIINPNQDHKLQEAVKASNTDSNIVDFVRMQTNKVKTLLEKYETTLPTAMIRNKLLVNFFEALRGEMKESIVDEMVHFLRAVKKIVKANFVTDYFYRTSEIIEEVRSLGGGIIIPHPEQFWPILLADYDVDGYEVWNPQSQRYTNFLINVVNRQNKSRKDKPILITMGDDCHMGEKVKDPEKQNREKAIREIGVQPAWEAPLIRQSLDMENVNRYSLIQEYKNRLN